MRTALNGDAESMAKRRRVRCIFSTLCTAVAFVHTMASVAYREVLQDPITRHKYLVTTICQLCIVCVVRCSSAVYKRRAHQLRETGRREPVSDTGVWILSISVRHQSAVPTSPPPRCCS